MTFQMTETPCCCVNQSSITTLPLSTSVKTPYVALIGTRWRMHRYDARANEPSPPRQLSLHVPS